MVFNVAQLHNMLWSFLNGLHCRELCSRFYKGSRKFLNPYISAVPESLIFM